MASLTPLAPRVPPPLPVTPGNKFWAAFKPVGTYLVAVLAAGPLGLWVSIFLLVLSGWVVLKWPYGLAWLPAPLAGTAALGLLIGPLALILGFFRRAAQAATVWFGVPPQIGRLVGVVALVTVVYFSAAPNSLYNVKVREFDPPSGGATGPRVDPRADLNEALSGWSRTCNPGVSAPVPLVIVALEGGASLSATWSLSVLAYLEQETDAQLSKHIFAISGVSGGSLGAVTYARLPREGEGCSVAPATIQAAAKALSEADLLKLTVASYFRTDFMHRLPVAGWLLREYGVGTRADALERSFRDFWRSIDQSPPSAAEGLIQTRNRNGAWDGRVPHLLLNGTDAVLGRRIITSTFKLSKAVVDPNKPDAITVPYFADADDFIALTKRDLPQATAVMNSARFPYLSPSGCFGLMGSLCNELKDGEVKRQIIDGGYFENFGAITALELAEAIEQVAPQRYLPIVLVISDEASIPEDELRKDVRSCGISCVEPDQLIAAQLSSGAGAAAVQLFAPESAFMRFAEDMELWRCSRCDARFAGLIPRPRRNIASSISRCASRFNKMARPRR
jgi:hypothetical protein